MRRQGGAKRWVAVTLEYCGSLLIVGALFLVFILFLYALFPSGTPLKELMEGAAEPGPGRYAGGRQVEATLSALQRDVRYRRSNSIAWGGASEGMPLYSQDAVQTLDHSGAKVSFSESDQLFLGSNSLMVVTRLNAEDEVGPKSYRVQVDGELRGNLSAARKLRMELSAAGHVARISSGAARFRLTPNGKDSQSLSVYGGEAQIVSGGRVIKVRSNHGVTLKKGAAVGPAVPLPAAPNLGEAAKARYRYRLLPPRVRFNWSGPAGDYHFQLSQDPSFKKCLIDEKVTAGKSGVAAADLRGRKGAPAGAPSTHEYVTGKLSRGNFYWRVSRVDEGREGAFSRVGECELVQMLDSPKLAVSFPPERAAAGPFLLTGTVAPGSRVFVDGVEVPCQTPASFECQLQLKPGVNLIRVEALDAAGNASYASRIVYGRSEEGSAQQGSTEPVVAP